MEDFQISDKLQSLFAGTLIKIQVQMKIQITIASLCGLALIFFDCLIS